MEDKVQELKGLIKKARHCYYSVTFVKANGEIRKMRCQNGVKKYLKSNPDKPHAADENPDVVKTYEKSVKGYRSFRLDRVLHFKCGKDEWRA